jgi:hypothetical protein
MMKMMKMMMMMKKMMMMMMVMMMMLMMMMMEIMEIMMMIHDDFYDDGFDVGMVNHQLKPFVTAKRHLFFHPKTICSIFHFIRCCQFS